MNAEFGQVDSLNFRSRGVPRGVAPDFAGRLRLYVTLRRSVFKIFIGKCERRFSNLYLKRIQQLSESHQTLQRKVSKNDTTLRSAVLFSDTKQLNLKPLAADIFLLIAPNYLRKYFRDNAKGVK